MRISDWSSDVCSSDLLFFRWKGWWGTPAAFRSPGAETEPRIALIARLSAAHAESLPTDPAEPPLLAGGTLERFSGTPIRSEEHTSELQSLMRISYAVFCLKKKKNTNNTKIKY